MNLPDEILREISTRIDSLIADRATRVRVIVNTVGAISFEAPIADQTPNQILERYRPPPVRRADYADRIPCPTSIR